MEWKVFYSWQSDSDRRVNESFIRGALSSACSNIDNGIKDIRFDKLEATRGDAGSISIPQAIFEKISIADIFVCDVSIINTESLGRKTPNPNVLVELGYAIALLGWERIIMVFNKSSGTIEDLPFDIRHHRILSYSIKDLKDKSFALSLASKLEHGIEVIIERNSQKPYQKSNSNLKRIKDIESITSLMETIPIGFIDSFLVSMPYNFDTRILVTYSIFESVYLSNIVHLYDDEAQRLFDDFYVQWGATLSYNGNFRSTNIPNIVYYGNKQVPHSVLLQEHQDLKLLSASVKLLRVNFKNLIKYIRKQYIEIDLKETSSHAEKLGN